MPKEWVLHATALAAGYTLWRRYIDTSLTPPAALLSCFCLASASSALLAQNTMAAGRMLALTCSATLLFELSSRFCSRAGSSASTSCSLVTLLTAPVIACALMALLPLLEAWSFLPSWSTPLRAPSGTFGNRNAMAHAVSLGMPAAALLCFRGRASQRVLGLVTLCLGSGAVLLSRCRAAWLALVVCSVLALAFRLATRRALLARAPGQIFLAVILGMMLSQLPNDLRWSSPTPLRDSLTSMLHPDRGSAAGRLAQAKVLVEMFRESPVLGVGPGNFRVHLPRVAERLSRGTVTPSQIPVRLPNNDWLGLLAERGLLAALCLIALAACLFTHWIRRLPADHACVGLLTLLMLLILGTFDAVISQAAPAMLAAVILGACFPSRGVEARPRTREQRMLFLALALVSAYGLARTTRQLWAGHLYSEKPVSVARYERAVQLDPGNDVLQRKLAEYWVGRGDCERAGPYLQALGNQLPHDFTTKTLRARCP